MNTGGHYPSSGRGIWTPDLQLMRLASYRTATIPRYWLLGTHLRDASLFATITPPAVPYRLGFEPRPFLWPIKIWRRRIAVCISVTPEGIEPSSPPWEGGVLTAWLRSHIRFLCLFIFTRTLPSETGKPCFVLEVTPTGLEPVTPPWKGGDLDHLSTGPQRGSNALFELAMPEPSYSALL